MRHDKRDVAIYGVLIILIASIGVSLVAGALVDRVQLNTGSDRKWIVYGMIEFTVAAGSASVNGVPIGPGDVVTLVVNSLESDEDWLRVWIGSWVTIDADADNDEAKLLVNGVEVASGDFTLSGVQADLATISSTLTVEVDPNYSGWTSLKIDGNTVIGGIDDSWIVVSGIAPSPSTGVMNLNAGTEYLDSGATTVEVNGQEVPWLTPHGLVAAALVLGAAGLIAARKGRA